MATGSGDAPEHERRRAAVLAGSVIALSLAMLGFTAYAMPLIPHGISRWAIIPVSFECLVAPIVGFLIVRQHPRHVIGWLLVLHGLIVTPVFNADAYAGYAYFIKHGGWPGAGEVAVFNDRSWPLLFLPLALIGYLFPDGRFLSRRWRRFVITCICLQTAFIVASALTITSFDDPTTKPIRVPYKALPEAPFVPILILGLICVPTLLVGSVLSARRRFKRAEGEERLQLLWFTVAALAIPGGITCCFLDPAAGGSGALTFVGVTVLGTVVPAVIGIAILRQRLFDVEVVLSRTLTYGTLTFLVIGVYAGVLAALSAAVDGTIAGLVAVGVVAVAIQPVHARVRRKVERWVYGDRSDPYAAVRRLSQRVEGLAEPAEIVGAVTGSIAEALRVDSVRVDLGMGEGQPDAADRTRRIPLIHQGERLGSLVVDIPPGRQFSPADDEMLRDLARHAAAVVNAVHLTLELQGSRARLVTAREEERRRLRRDLHDGVGPSLAAMVLKLNAIRRTVDNHVASELVAQVSDETKGAIAEIRRLVDDLRPPALDEVGLVAALRQKAAALSESPLLIEVTGPDVLPALPAAVEVAAYRIALEAMTNTARHSSASRCVVVIAVNGVLEVDIADNGTGITAEARSGVGLSSMRERAAELSGSCSVTRRGEGGTLVRAVIPLPDLEVVVSDVPAPALGAEPRVDELAER